MATGGVMIGQVQHRKSNRSVGGLNERFGEHRMMHHHERISNQIRD